jgi:hypothetical protein
MSDSRREHVNAAEEDPTTPAGDSSDSHGVAISTDAPVSALVTEEDDLPDRNQDDEVQVGLGPAG